MSHGDMRMQRQNPYFGARPRFSYSQEQLMRVARVRQRCRSQINGCINKIRLMVRLTKKLALQWVFLFEFIHHAILM